MNLDEIEPFLFQAVSFYCLRLNVVSTETIKQLVYDKWDAGVEEEIDFLILDCKNANEMVELFQTQLNEFQNHKNLFLALISVCKKLIGLNKLDQIINLLDSESIRLCNDNEIRNDVAYITTGYGLYIDGYTDDDYLETLKQFLFQSTKNSKYDSIVSELLLKYQIKPANDPNLINSDSRKAQIIKSLLI